MTSLNKETQTKAPVEIVQELIAIHTTRKEACDKLASGGLSSKLESASQQSDRFIAELMNELSNFGDAVLSDVERENDYQSLWKNTLGKLDGMNEQEKTNAFQVMEDKLKKVYQNLLETNGELPASSQEILTRQMQNL